MTQSYTPSDRVSSPVDNPAHITTDAPTTPLPGMANKVTCPVCGTTFAPPDTDGKCPVCGEQVMRAGASLGAIPALAPFLAWVRQGGNWKIVALAILILYQIVLFTVLWIHLAQLHAL